jgi:hypothetical protein
MKDNNNVTEAKQSLKSHIKFLEALLDHVKGEDEIMKGRAMWTTWCLHRYINDGLIKDLEKAMRDQGSTQE